MDKHLINKGVLILVLLAITALFLRMLLPFLQLIFLSALFAALFTPLYRRILVQVGERESLASAITLVLVLVFVGAPLVILFTAVLDQALDVAQGARPWVQERLATPGAIGSLLESLPFYDRIEPYREVALARLGQLASTFSGVLIDWLQLATVGTLNAVLSILIVVYTMFYFLMDGDRLLYYLLYYLPLNDEDEAKLLNRFVSVTRATLRGTAVIGVLQGGLAGAALYFAGVPSPLFWSVAMMFMSVVPGVGTALVWVPAVIWLLVSGSVVPALIVAGFCALVVGTLDNVLRPRLVGNDVELHDLMIFFSTLGGLLLFGFTGFIIGPIIAALFVTVWELYGEEFRDWLPMTAFRPRGNFVLPHERPKRMRRRVWSANADAGFGSRVDPESDARERSAESYDEAPAEDAPPSQPSPPESGSNR